MRDNHEGMPEIIEVFEVDGQYFGVVGVEIGGESRKFCFGVSQAGYRALKRVLQLRPFDSSPGLKYHYYFAAVYRKAKDSLEMQIRVEQGKNGKQCAAHAPKDLLANLRLFMELKDFSEAAYLSDVPDCRTVASLAD